MSKNKTTQIFLFIKKKELVSIDEIKKEFPNLSAKSLSYHLNKTLNLGVKKIQKGLYVYEIVSDKYHFLNKLNKNNVIAYHTALEFFGLGHTVFFSSYVMNPANMPIKEDLHKTIIYFVKPTIGVYQEIKRNNITFKVTPLEATFLDCLLKPKYCGGFEELLRCLQGLDGTNEDKINLNKDPISQENTELNLNYLYELLKKYNIKKLYNLTGFTLEILKKYWQIDVSNKFLNKINKEIRKDYIVLESSHSNVYKLDKKWNIKYPKELESAITGVY